MHFTEHIHKLYFKLPDFHRLGIVGKVIDRLIAKLVKVAMEIWLPDYYKKTIDQYRLGNNDKRRKGGQKIICSLTSFPARIDSVWLSIESLFRQSIPPDKIILWLSLEQFPSKKLPESLQKLKQKGLEIRYCEGDMKAHKKYLYALEEYPDDLIITYDDDLYYDFGNIENLLFVFQSNPSAICTNRAHRVKIRSSDSSVCPYRNWSHNIATKEVSHQLFATGGYGTLYQKALFAEEVTREDLIKKLSFFADDVWLKVMAIKKGTKVATNSRYGKNPITVGDSQQEKLVTNNVVNHGNDTQLKATLEFFNIPDEAFFKN